jgi:hypothetical protein
MVTFKLVSYFTCLIFHVHGWGRGKIKTLFGFGRPLQKLTYQCGWSIIYILIIECNWILTLLKCLKMGNLQQILWSSRCGW